MQADSPQHMFTASAVQAMPATSIDHLSYRVPKLAVRNRAPAHSASHSSKDQDSSHQEHASAHLMRPGSGEAEVQPALRNAPRSNLRQPAQEESRQERSATKPSGKQKPGSVLSFFMLREPSTSALEGLAEQERRRMASQKGSKMLSSVKKLPSNVPKVNSKWNGLPDSAQRKTGIKEASPRPSQASLSSRHSCSPDASRTRSAKPRPGSPIGRSQMLAAADDLTTPEDSPRRPSNDRQVTRTGHGPALSPGDAEQEQTAFQSSEPGVLESSLRPHRYNVLSSPLCAALSPHGGSTTPNPQKLDEVLPWEVFETMERSSIYNLPA